MARAGDAEGGETVQHAGPDVELRDLPVEVPRHEALTQKLDALHLRFGAAPAVVWASGLLFAAFFAVLMPLAAMIYMAVLVFTALWFAHYTLDELQLLRDKNGSMAVFAIQNESRLANTA